jgi:hypothetical protein
MKDQLADEIRWTEFHEMHGSLVRIKTINLSEVEKLKKQDERYSNGRGEHVSERLKSEKMMKVDQLIRLENFFDKMENFRLNAYINFEPAIVRGLWGYQNRRCEKILVF